MSLLGTYLIVIIGYWYVRIGYWYFRSYKSDICTDGYFTLLVREQMHKDSLFKRIKYVERIAVRTPMFYPPIPMFIASFLPNKVSHKYFGLINSTIDFLLLLILLFVSHWLLLPVESVMIFSFGFICLPCTFDLNITSNIHFNLSWRDLGKLASSGYFLAYFLFDIQEGLELHALVSLSILSVITLYTSLFAKQAIVFGSIVLSMIRFDYIPVSAILISNLLLLVIDFSWLIKYYKIRYTHFKSYFVSMRKSHPGTSGINAFQLSHIVDVIKYLGTFDWKALKLLLKSDPILKGIYLFPTQIPVAILLFMSERPESKVLLSWYFTAVVLWLLTSNKWLKIFGEPDRYLEFFGHFPIILGLGVLISDYTYNSFEFWILVASVAVLPLYFRRSLFTIVKSTVYPIYSAITKKQGYQRPNLKTVSRYDFQGLKDKVVLPVSFSNAWKIAYKFDCKVIFPPMFTDAKKTSFISKYPLPNWKNIHSVIDEFNIEYFVIEKTYMNDEILNRILEMASFEDEIGPYSLYKVFNSIKK